MCKSEDYESVGKQNSMDLSELIGLVGRVAADLVTSAAEVEGTVEADMVASEAQMRSAEHSEDSPRPRKRRRSDSNSASSERSSPEASAAIDTWDHFYGPEGYSNASPMAFLMDVSDSRLPRSFEASSKVETPWQPIFAPPV